MTSENNQDASIIEAIKAGGQQRENATQVLLRKYIYFIPKLARQFNLSEEFVMDAYTDALLLTMDHILSGRFRGDSKIGTYLYQILYNKCRDLLKKKSTYIIPVEDWLENTVTPSKEFLQAFFDKEAVAELHRYLDKLGEPCKKILLDWGYWGYNMTEIAERVGLDSSEQAKRKKYKCLKKLQQLLNTNE